MPLVTSTVVIPEFDVRRYGAKGDGIVDDTAAIVAALAALPPYSSEAGGGMVVLPGKHLVSSTITLSSGQRLVGSGQRASIITGTITGPIITTPNDGSGNPISAYQAVENVAISNASTNAAACAILLRQVSNATLWRCLFSAVAGSAVILRGAILSDVMSCRVPASGAEAGIFVDGGTSAGNSNVIRLLNNSVTDSKGGIAAVDVNGLVITGNQMEAIAGGGSYPGGIFIGGCRGGVISGNYFEAIHTNGIVASSVPDYNYGFEIGGNYFYNLTNNAMDLSNLRDSVVLPNIIVPGPLQANIFGVYMASSGAVSNTIFPQKVTSGTGGGVYLDPSAPSNRYFGGTGLVVVAYVSGNWTAAPSTDQGDVFQITATDGGGMYVGRPSPQVDGMRITYDIYNASGGALTTSGWSGHILAGAFVFPANTKHRTISFYYNGSLNQWVETNRSAADIG